jgi:hypothetical protein
MGVVCGTLTHPTSLSLVRYVATKPVTSCGCYETSHIAPLPGCGNKTGGSLPRSAQGRTLGFIGTKLYEPIWSVSGELRE